MLKPFTWPDMDRWILEALDEDIGPGDVTTECVVPETARAKMTFIAKSDTVACALFAAVRVFELLDPRIELINAEEEGVRLQAGQEMLSMSGSARALLSGERTALNILQRSCGTAYLTRKFTDAVSGREVKVAATRKTTPGFRRLEKYAVVAGGGVSHRFGLFDGVLIKDNHIAMAGSVREAVSRAKRGHHLLKVEVEVKDLAEAREAMEAGADLLLLDNMSPEAMAETVRELGKIAQERKVLFEASGNVDLENVSGIAASGVDIISIGALTHSAPAADISADMVPLK